MMEVCIKYMYLYTLYLSKVLYYMYACSLRFFFEFKLLTISILQDYGVTHAQTHTQADCYKPLPTLRLVMHNVHVHVDVELVHACICLFILK